MELVYIVLNKPDRLSEILSLFLEYEIHGATVIDSGGMGHLIANQSPMFSMFAELKEDKHNSKMIMTVVDSQAERDLVLKAVEDVLGDINEPDTAVFFTTPVSFSKGMDYHEDDEGTVDWWTRHST